MRTKLKRWKGRIGHKEWSREWKNEEVKRDTFDGDEVEEMMR